MHIQKLSKQADNLSGNIHLPASKSISNRVLIIQALANSGFDIRNLSDAEDTKVLQEALKKIQKITANQLFSKVTEIDVGHTGTACRFLTALLSITDGAWVLTGSKRMRQRPIQVLVEALHILGAEIIYLEKEGYLPLRITGKKLAGGKIHIDATISSQYLSALLMIAPCLEKGITLSLQQNPISKPYLDMTLELMQYLGASVSQNHNEIKIFPGKYRFSPITVEPDWSAASYFYSLLALSQSGSIFFPHLQQVSLQGDRVIVDIMKNFGIQTSFEKDGVRIHKEENKIEILEYDFINCPDIAQTVIVTCAGLGISCKATGLKSLKIKETDRIVALQNELVKLGISVRFLGDSISIHGKANQSKIPIKTYKDHRMAMAFAPLVQVLGEVEIENPKVVEKSFPRFWEESHKIIKTSSRKQ